MGSSAPTVRLPFSGSCGGSNRRAIRHAPTGALPPVGTAVSLRGFLSASAVCSGAGLQGFPLVGRPPRFTPCTPAPNARHTHTFFDSTRGVSACGVSCSGLAPLRHLRGAHRPPPCTPRRPDAGSGVFHSFPFRFGLRRSVAGCPCGSRIAPRLVDEIRLNVDIICISIDYFVSLYVERWAWCPPAEPKITPIMTTKEEFREAIKLVIKCKASVSCDCQIDELQADWLYYQCKSFCDAYRARVARELEGK